MVDGGKGTQAVVAEPEVRACCFSRHVERKQEALRIDSLRQTVEHAGDQQNMAILNWTHL